jgi:hypothetical protein
LKLPACWTGARRLLGSTSGKIKAFAKTLSDFQFSIVALNSRMQAQLCSDDQGGSGPLGGKHITGPGVASRYYGQMCVLQLSERREWHVVKLALLQFQVHKADSEL